MWAHAKRPRTPRNTKATPRIPHNPANQTLFVRSSLGPAPLRSLRLCVRLLLEQRRMNLALQCLERFSKFRESRLLSITSRFNEVGTILFEVAAHFFNLCGCESPPAR